MREGHCEHHHGPRLERSFCSLLFVAREREGEKLYDKIQNQCFTYVSRGRFGNLSTVTYTYT